jgi:hypothetical protein
VTERDAAKIRTRFMEGLKVSTRGNQQTYDRAA